MLYGELAVPCNLQSALAGLNSAMKGCFGYHDEKTAC